MKITELVAILGLKVYSGSGGLQNEITGGYVSDLLSDVVGNAESGQVWITLQNHKNILAVASLKELSAVILVKGQVPEPDTLLKSNEENIPVLGTGDDTFHTAGKLYEILMD